MAYDTAHEFAFVETFLTPASASRARSFLNKARRRDDLLAELFRGKFRTGKCLDVPPGQLRAMLRGVEPDVDDLPCYVIAQSPKFDQTIRTVKDCLGDAGDINYQMTGCFILSIVPGRLAVYWEDYGNTACICKA